MNKEEILNKYINLIDKGYCSDCNELNCIDNFPQAKITHAIRKLQQENKQLKDNWTKLKEYIRKNIIYDDIGMKILDPSPLEDYMQKLEQRSDK